MRRLGFSTIISIFAMSSKQKLIKRFCSLPSDFTFDELVRLFAIYGFILNNKGKTSGSRVEFIRASETFKLHRPHPGNIMNQKVLIEVYRFLRSKDHGLFEI